MDYLYGCGSWDYGPHKRIIGARDHKSSTAAIWAPEAEDSSQVDVTWIEDRPASLPFGIGADPAFATQPMPASSR